MPPTDREYIDMPPEKRKALWQAANDESQTVPPTDPTAALRTAWERYFNGYLFTKPTAIRSTETSWVHRERVLFEQGWHAALASQADDSPVPTAALRTALEAWDQWAADVTATHDREHGLGCDCPIAAALFSERRLLASQADDPSGPGSDTDDWLANDAVKVFRDDPSGPDVEAAWEALLDCSDPAHGDSQAEDISHHRPIIEAAIRAESGR